MNSRDTSQHRFFVVFAVTGIVLGAALLVHLLYEPTPVALSEGQKFMKTDRMEAFSVSPSHTNKGKPSSQVKIDTIYIYNQQTPLIVNVPLQSQVARSSVASAQKKLNNNSSNPGESKSKEETEGSGKMKAFEEAFNKVVEQQKQADQTQISEAAPAENRPVDHGIMSEGMLLDETQTRMGGTFFSYFYNHWQPPENASNFMITISEKMIPSMGSSVTIKIDEELVFQTRLQPRYDYIEQMGKQAVAICYRSLYQKAANSEYFEVF